MKRKVLVVQALDPVGMKLLDSRDDIEVDELQEISEQAIAEKIGDAHAVTLRAGSLTEALIAQAPLLQVVSRHGVGYDAVDVAALTRRGIPLTVTGTANSISVAEHALYLMLALAKRGREDDRATRANNWGFRNQRTGLDLYEKTLLIIGFGRIGKAVAPRCQALGMQVLACDPFIDQGVIEAHGCRPVEDFHSVLDEVDVLTVHTPLDDATRDMIGAAELGKLKPGAIVVNCARGGIINEAALTGALKSEHLHGAGLDVFVDEPLPPDSPLLKLDNVLLSPHTAAFTREGIRRMSTITVQNVLDAFDGTLNPDHVINRDVL